MRLAWRGITVTAQRGPLPLHGTMRAGRLRALGTVNAPAPATRGFRLLPTPTASPYGRNRSRSPGVSIRPSLAALPLLRWVIPARRPGGSRSLAGEHRQGAAVVPGYGRLAPRASVGYGPGPVVEGRALKPGLSAR